MGPAIVALACVADPPTEVEWAQLGQVPVGVSCGGAVVIFRTATSAVDALLELRTKRPFLRAAIDVAEIDEAGTSELRPEAWTETEKLLGWLAGSEPGDVMVSDLAYRLAGNLMLVDPEQGHRAREPHRIALRAVASPVLPLPHPLHDTRSNHFTNRPGPWAMLERAWAEAGRGQRRVVLLEGAAGSGKTRLVGEFARYAAIAGGIVLYGGSTEPLEVPFQPFGEALRPVASALVERAGHRLDDRVMQDLALVFPWAATGTASGPRSGRRTPRTAETDRHWAFEAVLALLEAAAELAPVLLVLDDLHWAQRPTIRLLDHLLRASHLERVCFIITAREEPADRKEPFLTSLATWPRLAGVERTALDHFSAADVRRFIANETGRLAATLPAELQRVSDHLSEVSGGNTFLLVEMWRHLLESGQVCRHDGQWSFEPTQPAKAPRSIQEIVDRRLGTLSRPARATVQTAACMGEAFELRQLASAVGSEPEELLDHLAEATSSGILQTLAAGRVCFVHALVRQSIEASLSPTTRARAHRAVARSLAAEGQDPGLIAQHFIAAVPLEPPATAVRFAREAATRSIETVSFDDAIGLLLEAEQIVDDELVRCDLLVDLADAYAKAGDAARAMAHGGDAAGIARRAGDQARLVRAATAIAESTWRGALPGGPAATALSEALRAESDPETRCRLLAGLAAAFALAGQEDPGRSAAAEALALAEHLARTDLAVEVINSSLYATIRPETVTSQLALSRRGMQLAVSSGDEYAELRMLCKMMLREFVLFDPDSVARNVARLGQLAQRFRQPYYLLIQAGYDTAFALCDGRFADAEAAAERYRRWSAVNHHDDGSYGLQMFSIRREQGRLAELRPVLELAARLGGGTNAWGPGLAAVYAEAGMLPEARALLDRLCADELTALPDDSLLPGVASFLADAASACAHPLMAELLLTRLAPYAGLGASIPGLACFGAADRYLGKLHSVLGDERAARRSFEAALDLDLRTGWPTWIAHSQHALAQHLSTSESKVERARAHELVSSAAVTADRLCMAALGRHAEALLGRLTAPGTDARLTKREREVLRLLSEGQSNRQIGVALHASQHTIANHVRSILAKTGSRNRTEAASWAHRHQKLAPRQS